jgi:tetratricopeptide (TPR) repeat protein
MLARARGDLEQAIAALEASLRTAETLADPLARIAALNNLALVYGEYAANRRQESAGQAASETLERAVDLAGQALALCQKRGDRHREAALHNNLADLLHRLGREDQSMDQLKQAVIIFAEIDPAPGQSADSSRAGVPAEIWKLTEW